MNSKLEQLRQQIGHIETAERTGADDVVTGGCAAIDRLLPAGGYSRGSLVQWITGGGQGADFLSLRVAREACRDGGALMVIDPHGQFYPPAAAAMGINLDHLIVLRGMENESAPSSDLLWAIDQSLRCPAVAAVWGPLETIDERWFRRFQLSAESSGCLGLFVQPLSAAREPSWAEMQWLVSSAASGPLAAGASLGSLAAGASLGSLAVGASLGSLVSSAASNTATEQSNIRSNNLQKIKLQLTRCRGTHTGKSVHVAINHVTGVIEVAAASSRSDRDKSRTGGAATAAGSLSHIRGKAS